jgi:CRP/FNR family transcriptional regulator, cyclic AMP receptor protein
LSAQKKVFKDNYLFREGDSPDAMYIVKTGEFAITKTKGNSEVMLAAIKAGQMVGEMAIFDRKPRSANVKATKDSEVIMLPYDGLTTQLESLPVWVKAIMRTMNDNLREANKKIKILETQTQDEDRFPPHIVNKLLTIVNFIGLKYGETENSGVLIPQNRLRNFTIQVFQEATNKMQSLLAALKEIGLFEISDLGEGRQKIVNLTPQFLFEFVDWYNDWIFKQDKDKTSFTAEEIRILKGVLKYSKKLELDAKGLYKVSLTDLQNDSMREAGFLIKPEELNSLIEKSVFSEKIMEEAGISVTYNPVDAEALAKNWGLIWDLKKLLK